MTGHQFRHTLGTHRRQATVNLSLITRAEANGQTRLAANLRQVQDNLMPLWLSPRALRNHLLSGFC